MTGEQLNKKLKDSGYVLADVARLLNVPPQSLNQTLNAKDIKTGFLEELCRVLNKDMSFFYETNDDSMPEGYTVADDFRDGVKDLLHLQKRNLQLIEENQRLRDELSRREDPNHSSKESEVYRLWMEHMRLSEKLMNITDRMRELYQKTEG